MKRRYAAEKKNYVGKLMISLILVTVIAVSSVVTVMANTVPCTVLDGDKSYEFSLLSPELTDIVDKAEDEGMPPLGPKDKVHSEKGNVVVDRALTVSVESGNVFTSVVAYEGETVEAALQNGKISYGENDLVEPALNTVIEGDMNVRISPYTPAVVTADGSTKTAVLYGGTVADALTKLNIKLNAKDQVSPALTAPLTENMKISVERVKNIQISDGGKNKKYKTLATTVEAALKDLGIQLGEEDQVSPGLKKAVKDGAKIKIDRITYEDVTETEAISYETVYEDDSSILEGEYQVQTAGQEGEKEVVYRSLYVNGVLKEQVVKSEKVTLEPVTEVILNGTKEPEYVAPPKEENTDKPSGGTDSDNNDSPSGSTFIDYNGNEVSYSNSMVGECTAYTDPGGITSLGESCQVGVVAVNPDVIPYGTRMYITSGSVVYGYAVAGDTGGAALANQILVDVYYDSESEVYNFGRRDMTVYILD